ncbi:MAG: hypothetical protein ACRD96_28990, partial [Bryobacteraceae bacterium]
MYYRRIKKLSLIFHAGYGRIVKQFVRQLWLAVTACLPVVAGDASNLFKLGRKAENQGEFAQAYSLYSRAAALSPRKTTYYLRSQAVRSRAAMQAKISLPPGSDQDLEADLAPLESLTDRDLAEARKLQPPQ